MFISIVFLIFSLTCLTSCVSNRFISETPFVGQTKEDFHSVEYLNHQPSRSSLRLGVISTQGDGFARFDDLIKSAKKKAAKLGGDFILIENSGVETSTYYSPGHSSYNASTNASYNSHSGHASGSAHGYSVGPTISTISKPWSVFSVWIYTPSRLGVRWQSQATDQNVISGFHLNSNAEKSGIKIGDLLLGIDDYDISDYQKVTQHVMTIHPGDRVKLTVLRDSKKRHFFIIAIPN